MRAERNFVAIVTLASIFKNRIIERKMILILHRYIFRETFKVFVLATLALSVILSLGMILRPVQEIGVGPRQVLDLIGYMLPITLTFVLPIAALFAASLCYGRFAADNELDACRASGIGMYSLVYPGLILAIMVAMANLFLSFYVTPAFVQRAEKALKADAQKIIFRNIQQKGFYKAPDGGWQIYADYADPKNEILSGVVITELKHSKIQRIVSCDDAYVHINTQNRFNEVQITAVNTSLVEMTDNKTSYAQSPKLSIRKEFPPLLGDDIKFKKIDEIKRIRADFMNFNPIAKEAYQVYGQYIAELLAQEIREKINIGDRFCRLLSGQKLLRFTADKCTIRGEQNILLEGNVTLEEYLELSAKEPDRTSVSSQASIQIGIENGRPSLTMVLYNANWHTKSGSQGIADRLTFQSIALPESITRIINDKSAASLLDIIRADKIRQNLPAGASGELKTLLGKLDERIRKVEATIKAQTQWRLSFGIGCIPLVLIGIGLGIIKKGGHLLSAFGVSTIPAAVLIVCIMSGKNLIENLVPHPSMGTLIIWAGPIILIFLTGVIYSVLLRH
jgi:lipopolysaccharide export LptBFGC system permease protein LptF